MTKPVARDPMYRQRAFDSDVIELCVRWYISYRLSYRGLVEMMAERSLSLIAAKVGEIPCVFNARWPRI